MEKQIEDLKCQLEREREYIEFLKANIVTAKQEVASKIFDDFNDCIDIVYDGYKNLYIITQKDYDKLIDKYLGEK